MGEGEGVALAGVVTSPEGSRSVGGSFFLCRCMTMCLRLRSVEGFKSVTGFSFYVYV